MGAQGILDGIAHQNATIMVVHSHGHGTLGVLLAHDILGQRVVDLVRGGHAGDDALGGLAHGGGRRLILVHIEIIHGLGVIHVRAKGTHHLVLREGLLEDLVTGLDAFIADEHAVLTLDELANLLLGLTAERAANLAVALHAGGAAELVARH